MGSNKITSTHTRNFCVIRVINHANGDLYGHIIAGSSGTGTAYVIPATQVFENLEQRLGGVVSLPTRDSLPSLRQQDTLSSPIVSEISDPDNPSVGARSYNKRDTSADPGPVEDDCENQGDPDSDDNPWNKDSGLEGESQSRHSLPRTKSSGSPEDPSLPIVAHRQSPPTSSSPMPPSEFPHYFGTSQDGKSFQGIPRELPYDQTAYASFDSIPPLLYSVYELPFFYIDTPPENLHKTSNGPWFVAGIASGTGVELSVPLTPLTNESPRPRSRLTNRSKFQS